MKKITTENNLKSTGNKLGIIAGIAIVVYLLIFQLNGIDYMPAYKVFKYLLLTIFMGYGIFKINKYDHQHIFKKGIGFGVRVSLIAATLMILSNILIYSFFPKYAFSLYALVPENLLQLSMVSTAILFEMVVFGFLISFAIVQFYKEPGPELK